MRRNRNEKEYKQERRAHSHAQTIARAGRRVKNRARALQATAGPVGWNPSGPIAGSACPRTDEKGDSMQRPIDPQAWFERVLAHVGRFRQEGPGAVRAAESESPIADCLAELFLHNATLWGYEDEVRRTDIADSEVARYKRLIDRENQLRNDHIDKADALLREEVEKRLGPADERLPLNTETPGSVFDRLTILALRTWHLERECERDDATPEHREHCAAKLANVCERTHDLLASLGELLDEILAGRKRLKAYGTHKLYNDPETNPAVRAARERAGA